MAQRRRIIVIMVILGILVIIVTSVLLGNICNNRINCNNKNANSNNTCSYCNNSEVWDAEASGFTDELPPLGLVRTWEPLGATLLFHAHFLENQSLARPTGAPFLGTWLLRVWGLGFTC